MILFMYIALLQGLTTPWGQNFDANRNILSLRSFVTSFKKKSDFIHFFHDFIHVYSPRAGADSPQGTKFRCQQKCLVTSFICSKFKKNVLYNFFHYLIHVYSPGAGADNPQGTILMSTERPYHFTHLLQVSKKSLWSLIYTIFSWLNTCI